LAFLLGRSAHAGRVAADGKHLSVDGVPFRVRGVTYGTFAPRRDGQLFPERDRIRSDLAAIAEAGVNVVRTYTLPPVELLETAEELELRVLIGFHYEDWRFERVPGRRARRRVLDAGRRAVEETMARCAGRSSVLAISVGNEVPGDVVRVHGIGAVEETLSGLVRDVHAADPDMLATYTSYPTTEYLCVEGQDLATFNVFLERPEQLRSYLRHLQVVFGDIPLVISELGLAGAVHGEEGQAESLGWQLRTVDETGCAGAVVFSWTDEWTVGGYDVEGWGFGLTDAARRPKAALETVRRWARWSVRDLRERWPRVSVVVCAHNGERLLEPCLRSLLRCDYPELEVLVCDDGSTDGTLAVAERFPFRVLRLPWSGLSSTRNAGIGASTGEIVAFLDADAQCHPEWPYHLALSLESEDVAATGGPNLPVPEARFLERAVAASPGGPVEVLVRADRAEHVPGCNMAFRRDALEAIGGFDPVYTTAGDDVDVCWKLLDRGHEIAFAPAAQVRHHRRDTVRGYLRQQRGYGRAERVLASAHRHRFNRLGQARWRGFIYGGTRIAASLLRPVVHHGPVGTAPFQPILRRRSEAALCSLSAYLPLLVPLALLGVLAPLSAWWLAAPALAVGLAASYLAAVAIAVSPAPAEPRPLALCLLVALLHLAQPLARTWGRLYRPSAEKQDVRSSTWAGERTAWLRDVELELARRGCQVRRSTETDAWDIEAGIGPFVRSRVTTAVIWRWTPVFRQALRARSWLLLPAATAQVPLLTGAVWWGVALLLVAGGWTAAEAGWLWRTVRAALEKTTVEATAPDTHSQLPAPALAQRHANQPAREARPGSGPVIPEGVYE
jgi:glycosyltransferase involved in cell wall biosynthesis